jgi:hypothetical protein
MSTARVGMSYRMPVQFCTDRVWLSRQSKPFGGLSAAYCRQGVARHSESRGVADAEANFDDPTTTSSLSQVASQGQ